MEKKCKSLVFFNQTSFCTVREMLLLLSLIARKTPERKGEDSLHDIDVDLSWLIQTQQHTYQSSDQGSAVVPGTATLVCTSLSLSNEGP